MKTSIYSYLDYRKFIKNMIESKSFGGRGERKRLAQVLGCQMAFITHVLNGDKDFNHEQLLKIAKHYHLNESEKEFFLDLLSFNRAGTRDLREFYEQRLKQKRDEYQMLKNRLQETQSLSHEDQARYYSHWLFGAIHMAATVPPLQSVTTMARYFNVSELELAPLLEFLAAKGLVILESGKVTPGLAHLYVSQDSPLMNQHHTIWRVKALHDLKSAKAEDLHYSLCFSVAEKDWPVLREKLLEAINDCLKVIRPSKEERLGLMCVDLQGV